MCGRFILSKPKKIKVRFKTQNTTLFNASYNIAPSETLPTITRNSPNQITMMRWGFQWSGKATQGVINIRKETIKEKQYFNKVFLTQRCIVPADGFYEWRTVNLEGNDEKYPFFIYLKGRALFGFAAIYNKLIDAEGKLHFTFAIITCPPNEIVKKVHHRMPAILERKDEDSWLDPENKNFKSLYQLVKPYEGEIKIHPVSKRVNNPRNDDRGLIKLHEETRLF